MHCYQFHGIFVRSGIPLGLPLLVETPPTETTYIRQLTIAQISERPQSLGSLVWTDPYHFPDGKPVARLFQNRDAYYLEAPKTGWFSFKENLIEVFLEGVEQAPVPYLLGRVFACYLELSGIPLLHGCAMTRLEKTGAIGFLGDSHAGKSTMGAAMVNRGRQLLTDDLIPLLENSSPPFFILPGIPMSRIWPDTGKHLVENFEQSPPIHPGGLKRKVFTTAEGNPRFSDQGRVLKALFILERRASGPISLQRVNPAAALMELVRTSYRPELVEAIGLQPNRMKTLAKVAASIPIVKLIYPTGFENLERVCDRVEGFLQKVAP